MITHKQVQKILENTDPKFIEELAQEAAALTQQYFGRTISLYTPLYLSNFCSSYCIYCGFNNHNPIKRIKLSAQEAENEMSSIKKMGIQNILLLTGESYKATPLSYLKEITVIAKNYFPSIGFEIHPLLENEYAELFEAGADGITIYQETYNQEKYDEVHIAGKKKDYAFRRETPQRIAKAGFRNISMGILLGLHDTSEDLLSLYQHLKEMEKSFPGIEYGVSFPRLRTIKNEDFIHSHVDDATLIKIICLTRILFPRVGINLSTRESATLRNHALGLGITRISAGSKTIVGGYSEDPLEEKDPQFDIKDNRGVNEIIQMLKRKSFDPVLTDWRHIENTVLTKQ